MFRSNSSMRLTWRRRSLGALRLVLSVALTVVFLELFLRVAHLGRAPLLPYVEGEGGVPMLPAGMDQTVSFWWGKPTKYVVDQWGGRIARPELRGEREAGGVLVVGDSQALGYQINFEQTFAAEIARKLFGRSDLARIVASPAMDPEQELFAVKRYVVGLPRQKLAVLVLNMSNDLDEMFIGAEGVRGAPRGALQNFLMSHCFLYMDWANVWQQYLAVSNVPPGVNPILYAMSSDERVVLADQTVRVLLEMAARIPAQRVIVVIIPNKYQVSVKLFEDFRHFYRSPREFNRWYAQMPNAADQMNALETYIVGRLDAADVSAIRFVTLAKASGEAPGDLFQKTSEHISERGHRLIADAILGAKV